MQKRTIKRLDPIIWVETPLGDADAEFLIEIGDEHHLQWICWIHETGECWTFPNHEVRKATNVDRKSTRLNSSHVSESRMPSSA